MLQPLQLEAVSLRCSHEIAELRDFFTKAGVALNTSGSFNAVAERVRTDRAFARDLTSHVWVFLNHRSSQISYSDMLGMVAIASAGPAYAASANETDAHFLLRFLIETRNAFHAPVPSTDTAPAAVPLATPIVVPRTLGSELRSVVLYPQESEEEDTPLSFEMPQDENTHRPLLWFAVAACLLAAVLGGFLLFHSPTASRPTTAAAIMEPAPLESSPATSASAVIPSQRHEEVDAVRSFSSRRSAVLASPTRPRRSVLPPAATVASTSGYSSPSAAISRPSGKPSPSTPAPTVAEATTSTLPNSPRLLRRSTTPSSSSPVSNTNRAPAVVNVTPLAASGNNTAPFGTPVQKATVRATSLGTMAGNVTYSPAPAYPSAASALHVQGEVKLEAEVDPSGTVVSTRIISGPPLLQEAAADAVQRWRYRPYLYNDKPIGTNTTVVMDFQLP